MLKGIDVSAVQGKVDWKALAAHDVKFGFAKCKQGNDGVDPFYVANMQGMRENGIRPFPYHFVYPLPHLDPAKQAEAFFEAQQAGLIAGEGVAALDYEWPDPDAGWKKWGCTPKQLNDFMQRCAARFAELSGWECIVYEYPYFDKMVAAEADVSWMGDHFLWIASYTPEPVVPKQWKTWTFWQYDGNNGERMPNGGDADFNWFNGDDEALAAFCRKAAPRPTEADTGSGPIIQPPIYDADWTRPLDS